MFPGKINLLGSYVVKDGTDVLSNALIMKL